MLGLSPSSHCNYIAEILLLRHKTNTLGSYHNCEALLHSSLVRSCGAPLLQFCSMFRSRSKCKANIQQHEFCRHHHRTHTRAASTLPRPLVWAEGDELPVESSRTGPTWDKSDIRQGAGLQTQGHQADSTLPHTPYTHTHTHAHTYTRAHIHTRTYKHAHMNAYKHAHMNAYTRTRTYTRTYKHAHMHAYTRTRIYTRTYARPRTRAHMHTHANTSMHARTCSHTNTRAHISVTKHSRVQEISSSPTTSSNT